MDSIIYEPEQVQLCIKIRPKKAQFSKVLKAIYGTIVPTHKEVACLEYKIFKDGEQLLVLGTWKNLISLEMHLLFKFHLDVFDKELPSLCQDISIKLYQEVEPPLTALSLG